MAGQELWDIYPKQALHVPLELFLKPQDPGILRGSKGVKEEVQGVFTFQSELARGELFQTGVGIKDLRPP